MRMKTALAIYLALTMMLPGCAAAGPDREQAEEIAAQAADQQVPAVQEEDPAPQSVPQPQEDGAGTASAGTKEAPAETEDPKEKEMNLTIGDTPVAVRWQDNESVKALAELVSEGPLTVQMSMYGGFEQVGPIGQDLPRNDRQTTTGAGDIVLYSGNQIVVFYGSNSWSYTRLGHIEGKTQEELAGMLGTADVTVTIDNAE